MNKQASTIGYLEMLRQNKPNKSTSKRDYWRVIISSELKDNIKREACAPRPSHYANQQSDYASNFIASSASLKRLPVARLSWKTRAESPAGTTSINQAGLKCALQRFEDRVPACWGAHMPEHSCHSNEGNYHIDNLITAPPGKKTLAAAPLPSSSKGSKRGDGASSNTIRRVNMQHHPQHARRNKRCGRTAKVQRNEWVLRQGSPPSLVEHGKRPAGVNKARHVVVMDAAQHHFALP